MIAEAFAYYCTLQLTMCAMRNRFYCLISIFAVAALYVPAFGPTLVKAQTPAASVASSAAQIRALKITVLSTMLVGDTAGLGEWGFSALVEADGHRILMDTGAHPETVLRNARDLGIDLSDVSEAILTHNHWDHVRWPDTVAPRDDEEEPSRTVGGACQPGNLL